MSDTYRIPGELVSAHNESLLADLGMDISAAKPRPNDFTEHQLAEQHLVVSLQGPVGDYLPQLPFHTAGIEWKVSAAAPQAGQSPDAESLKTLYRELGSQISELMHLLRGEDAP